MGHHISAALLKGLFDTKIARDFRLTPRALPQDVTLFPLHYLYSDHWTERLGLEGPHADHPLLDGPVVHYLMKRIVNQPFFAVVETNYFGGLGTQSAAVYHGDLVVMPPTLGRGTINQALRHLGVQPQKGADEFDTVGLGNYRDFDDLFESYRD
jgi:hypothetical protein